MAAAIADLNMVSSTELGREWLLKALHPAEPSVSGTQCPDGTELDTVPLELTMTYSLAAPGGVPFPAAWGAQISVLPSIFPLAIYPTGGAVGVAAFNVRYPQISGTNPNNDFLNLMANVEALRLTFCSATIHLDANATTDQGTIVACQQLAKPQMLFMSQAAGVSVTPITGFHYTVPFTTGDVPGYDQIMAMPRAYQANMREGVYLPLRLSNTSQHWFSLREAASVTDLSALTSPALYQYKLNTTAGSAWPYWSCDRAYLNGTNILAPPLCPMLGETVGHISITNLHPSSGIVIKVRTGLELKVQSQSPYLPYARPSADVDVMAVESYFRIVRQLEDAYPASYNATGEILKLVSKAVRTVAPLLAPIPGFGPLIAAAGGPVAALASYGAKRLAQGDKKKKKPKKKQDSKSKEEALDKLFLEAAAKAAAKQGGSTRKKKGKKKAKKN